MNIFLGHIFIKVNETDFESYENNSAQYTMKYLIQEVAKEMETLSGTIFK